MTDLMALSHRARQGLADDLEGLAASDWARPSLCPGWDVEHVVAHLTAAASTSQRAWLRSIVLAGFRPTVHNERRLREHLGKDPAETLARFRAVITSTVAPPRTWLPTSEKPSFTVRTSGTPSTSRPPSTSSLRRRSPASTRAATSPSAVRPSRRDCTCGPPTAPSSTAVGQRSWVPPSHS